MLEDNNNLKIGVVSFSTNTDVTLLEEELSGPNVDGAIDLITDNLVKTFEVKKDVWSEPVFKLVEKHGGVLRFVGGAVRDAIAGFERAKIDLVTDLSPSEFSDMCDDEGLRCVPIGIQFFTIGVMVNSSFFKVTSLSPEEDNIKDEFIEAAAPKEKKKPLDELAEAEY